MKLKTLIATLLLAFPLSAQEPSLVNGNGGGITNPAFQNAVLPSQSTHGGKYLKTNGTAVSWETVTSDLTSGPVTSSGGVSAIADGALALAKLATDPLARANHTGTQALSTLSQSSATTNQVPKWSGSAWVPAADVGSEHSGLFTDAEIPNCTLDLDASTLTGADGSNVTSWTSADAAATVLTSLGGAHPTLKMNAVNGQPGVLFNGTSAYMRNTAFFTNTSHAAATVFVVFKSTKTAFDGISGIGMVFNATWPNFYFFHGSIGNPVSAGMNFGTIGPQEGIPRMNDTYIGSAQRSAAMAGVQSWTNGMIAHNSESLYGAGTNTATGDLTVGNNSILTASYYFGGYIARIILFNRVLTETEVNKINHGLRQKYGTAQKQSIILDGDSVTLGTQSSGTHSLQYYAGIGFPDWHVSNLAVGGRTSTQRLVSVVRWSGIPSARSVVCYMIGTNDVRTAGFSTATFRANLQNYCAELRRNGKAVLISTIPSCNPSSLNADVLRDTENTWIRANWKTFADGLIDYASVPEIGALGAYANATYFFGADGVHPIPAGYDKMGPVLQSAINEYLGTQIAPRSIASGAENIWPSDDLVTVTGTTGATLTLPLPATVRTGKIITIKDGGGNAGTNVITLTGTVDGAVNPTISTNYGSKTIYSNGTVWLNR